MTITIGERRKRLPLRLPFQKAVDNFRSKALRRKDYDPATLFVWGQLMSLGVLRLVKAMEERFGAEGQEVCRLALNKLAKDVFLEMASGIEIPPDITPVELASLVTTWINEVLYASIEEPFVKSEQEAGFHIHYCPHQDVYRSFDCRVQRYFVEGILQAARELWGTKAIFNASFRYGIPQGYDTCLFDIALKEGEEDSWREYTEKLQQRALKRLSQR
jgi:hypothetical protein